MWQPWSAALEWLGRLRFAFGGSTRLRVGVPEALDAAGSMDWQQYRRAEALFDVWAPHPASVWVPFHSVPLFAALDRLPPRSAGPALAPAPGDTVDPRGRIPPAAWPGNPPPPFLAADTWIILDMPGPASVQVAVWLIRAGCQPVCTFDNWPHPKGVLKAELTLAELLRWASTVAPLREQLHQDSPPLWICDSERLGRKAGSPGEFDNRYYLDDSTLPGPRMLAAAGIRRVVYITLSPDADVLLDLESYFSELLTAGFVVEHAHLGAIMETPRAFAQPPTPRRLATTSYRRSSAGGFGTEVPQPSSSGG